MATTSSDHSHPDDSRSIPHAILVAAAISLATVLLFTLASSATTLFDRDEPRFAQATIEMIASGNWLYPTFEGNLRPDKPILIYWLMSVPVRLLGNTEWALRLPSALGVGIAALATFIAARRLVSERAALLAMLILVSSPLTMLMGTAATADGWLLGMTTAAIASFVCAFTTSKKPLALAWLVSMMIFCGLAQLTKGPVGLAVIGFPVVGTLLLSWRRTSSTRWLLGPVAVALALSVGMFLAWAIPANSATQGEFAAQGLGKHVLSRVLAPMEGHGGSFLLTLPYYIPVLIAGFFPWVIFLPAALAHLIRRDSDDCTRRVRIMALAWILPTFVMMSLVATKLPHYVLPIWPALAIVCAAWFARKARFRLCAVIAVCMLIAQQLVAQVGLRLFEGQKLTPQVVSAIRARDVQELDVLAVRFGEPSLVFYLWPQHVQIEGSLEAMATWKIENGPSLLIVPKRELSDDTWHQPAQPDRFELIAEVEGFNYSTGDWLTLVIIGRDLEARESTAPRQDNVR